MKINLPKIPEGLKFNYKNDKESKKPTFLAPSVTEYYLHPQGSIRRVDLRGISRKDWRAERRLVKRSRIQRAKYYKALGKQLVSSR